MENLRKILQKSRILFLTLLWLCWLIFVPTQMALAEEDYEYYQPSLCKKPNTTTSNPTPAVMLIGGADSGADGGKKATQWFLERADRGDNLVVRFGQIGRQAQWICENFPRAINSAAELAINTRNLERNLYSTGH